jgi:hypothetical protein
LPISGASCWNSHEGHFNKAGEKEGCNGTGHHNGTVAWLRDALWTLHICSNRTLATDCSLS